VGPRSPRLTHHPGLWLTYQPGLYPHRPPPCNSPLGSPQPLEAFALVDHHSLRDGDVLTVEQWSRLQAVRRQI
jgi:hypothetical protein